MAFKVSTIEREQLVIGAFFKDASWLDDCQLCVDDFSTSEHREYFKAINRAASEGKLNEFYVRDIFRAETNSSHDLILDYAAHSLQITKSSFDSYCEDIREQSVRTKAVAIAQDMINSLQEGKSESVDIAINKLMNIGSAEAKYLHSFDEVASMIVDEAEKAFQGETGSLKTNMRDLDQSMGGLFPGDLVIIPARPAQGKTAVLINMILKSDAKPGVISGEQGAAQMGVRAACIGGKMNHHKFRTGDFDDKAWDLITAGSIKFQEKGGMIYDKPAPTMADVEKVCRVMVRKHGVNALFIDYAQRIKHEDGRMPKWEQQADIAQRLKELARTLNVPVVALAQVNRSCEARTDKRPEMGDIANASEYEKEADSIITLYRDEVYNEDTPDKGIIELDFKKNRHGPTGCIRMVWNAKYMRVDDFSGAEYSQEQEFLQSDGYIG